MSNFTDGKKALASGDFELAQDKFTKAMDVRAHDSELWWAVMLCKFKWRNDDELYAAVKQKFRAAAESGQSRPSTPFETSYCKNALLFDKTGRRAEFIEQLMREVAAEWLSIRGKPLKLTIKSARSSADRLNVCTIIAFTVAIIGAVLAVVGIMIASKPLFWVGIGVFIAFAVVTTGLRFAVKKAGGNIRAAGALIIILAAMLCIVMLVIGLFYAVTTLVIIATVVLVIIAVGGAFNMAYKTRERRPTTRGARNSKRETAREKHGARGETLQKDGRAAAYKAVEAIKKEKRKMTDDYEDSFDD